MKATCFYCGKTYNYTYGKRQFDKTKRHFCSRECFNKGRSLYDEPHSRTSKRYMLWNNSKHRAMRKGLEFNLELDDIPQIPEYCPVLGLKLDVNAKSFQDNSPTLDRIDSSKGYVKGNIRIISYRANMLKSNATFEEIKKIYKDSKRIRKKRS